MGVNPQLSRNAAQNVATYPAHHTARAQSPLFYGTIDGLTFAVPAMKLLLIEDNPTLAHWLAKMLEQEAFALDTVQDGDAADQLCAPITTT